MTITLRVCKWNVSTLHVQCTCRVRSSRVTSIRWYCRYTVNTYYYFIVITINYRVECKSELGGKTSRFTNARVPSWLCPSNLRAATLIIMVAVTTCYIHYRSKLISWICIILWYILYNIYIYKLHNYAYLYVHV